MTTYMREKDIVWRVSNLKPNTKYFAFFAGIDVTQYMQQEPYFNSSGGHVSQNTGELNTGPGGIMGGVFNLPGNTFVTGTAVLLITDTLNVSINDVANSNISKASVEYYSDTVRKAVSGDTIKNTTRITPEAVNKMAVVNSTGVLSTLPDYKWLYDNTEVSKNISTDSVSAVRTRTEPIAQSFSTQGIAGGFFLTAIDLFFYSKDTNLPVTIEIRQMNNGIPADNILKNSAKVVLQPENIYTSNLGTAPTRFSFVNPVYLSENVDYCFVIQSNSGKFSFFSSIIGNKSVSSDAVVTTQPYNGTLFKYSSSVGWSAEVLEDIKFTMYKAQYSTTIASTARFKLRPPENKILGKFFHTSAGSLNVTVGLTYEHALQVNDLVKISPPPGCVFNGISSDLFKETNLNLGAVRVVSIPTQTSFIFQAGTAATSTGLITASQRVLDVIINSVGANYPPGRHDLIFTPTGGDIITVPAVGVVDVSISGNVKSILLTAYGSGYINRPDITFSNVGIGGGAVLYAELEPFFYVTTNHPLDKATPFFGSSTPVGTSIKSNYRAVSGRSSVGTEIPYIQDTMSTSVSLKDEVVFRDRKWILNEANAALHGVDNYLAVELSTNNPNTTPQVSGYETGGHILSNSYELNNQRGENTLSTNPEFNSEIGNFGSASARYISNKISLNFPAVGLKMFVVARSEEESAFDVYIRTGQSNTNPNSLNSIDSEYTVWQPLTTIGSTNKSREQLELYEYQFDIDRIPEFDVFQIKIVLRGTNPARPPVLFNYRAIALAL